jgi:hypothetical protein
MGVPVESLQWYTYDRCNFQYMLDSDEARRASYCTENKVKEIKSRRSIFTYFLQCLPEMFTWYIRNIYCYDMVSPMTLLTCAGWFFDGDCGECHTMFRKISGLHPLEVSSSSPPLPWSDNHICLLKLLDKPWGKITPCWEPLNYADNYGSLLDTSFSSKGLTVINTFTLQTSLKHCALISFPRIGNWSSNILDIFPKLCN